MQTKVLILWHGGNAHAQTVLTDIIQRNRWLGSLCVVEAMHLISWLGHLIIIPKASSLSEVNRGSNENITAKERLPDAKCT